MKSVNVYFEDFEWEKLMESKGKLTWREFVLKLVRKQENTKKIVENVLNSNKNEEQKLPQLQNERADNN